MSNKVEVRGGGIGFLGVLGALLVVFKLAGVGAIAQWSWWLVMLPFYLVPLIFLIIFFIALTLKLTGVIK